MLTSQAAEVWKAQHSFNRKIFWRNATEQFMYSHWPGGPGRPRAPPHSTPSVGLGAP